jgi:hypothetical protein
LDRHLHGILVPLAVIAITTGVGIWTYARQQRDRRRDALRDLFSEALRAVADYQELPYLIRRRSHETPMTPSELSRHASDVQSRLDFYVARLQLESAELGDAYERLVRAARQEAGSHMSEAWQQPRIGSDEDMSLRLRYPRDSADEQRAMCLPVMREHLGEGQGWTHQSPRQERE